MSAPLLEARAVSVARGGRPVVKDVSLALRAGDTVALVGPNAAGKSTLLHALAGALAALSGEVRAAGDDLQRLPPRERARRIAVVPQSARHDLDFTVREIVALGRTPHSGAWGLETPADREAIEQALDRLDLRAVAGRSFAALSGGERQRTLVARALAQHAPVLLLDEPTAHLDLGHQLLVLDLVQTHARAGGAALVVLHDLSMAARLDAVAVLDGGRLVAHGPAVNVLSPARLRETWGVDGALERTEAGMALALRGPVPRP